MKGKKLSKTELEQKVSELEQVITNNHEKICAYNQWLEIMKDKKLKDFYNDHSWAEQKVYENAQVVIRALFSSNWYGRSGETDAAVEGLIKKIGGALAADHQRLREKYQYKAPETFESQDGPPIFSPGEYSAIRDMDHPQAR